MLAPVLGCRVELVGGYDADRLGTFTRDIPRLGTQIETAREKARIGMELAGLPLGLASEGAFGLDPLAGMLPWNVEILVLIDDENDLELIGMAQGGGGHAHSRTGDWSAAENLAAGYQSTCLACGSPGFWAVVSIAGLSCQRCGAPTRETRAEVRGCLKCAHRELLERTDVTYADPGRCDRCNR